MFGTCKFVTTRTVSHHGTHLVRDLGLLCRNMMLRHVGIMVVNGTRSAFLIRGEHGQDQDWISYRILAIFLDQDWIWIFIF